MTDKIDLHEPKDPTYQIKEVEEQLTKDVELTEREKYIEAAEKEFHDNDEETDEVIDLEW